jgi:chromosome segregation ATPase
MPDKKNMDELKEEKKACEDIIESYEKELNKLEEALKENNEEKIEDIKESFESFFDEDSGNETAEEGLDQVEKFLKEEIESFKNKLTDIQERIDNYSGSTTPTPSTYQDKDEDIDMPDYTDID